MSESKSPSPIISYFVREIEPSFPATEKAKLATYGDAIAKTTHHGDLRRAWRCAEWAIKLAERSSSSHPNHLIKHLKEIRNLEKDTVFGAGFGGMVKDGVGPGEDAEIQWVDDTVVVAKAEAGRTGWDSVPWEELLKEMLAVATPKD